MNSVLMVRIILGIIVFVIIILLFKLHKAIKTEKRIAQYSLNMDKQDDISFFDSLVVKYHKFVKRFKKDEKLVKYSKSYEKYVQTGERLGAIRFVINKLLIGFSFVCLVVISYAIRGKIVGLFGICFSFLTKYFFNSISCL